MFNLYEKMNINCPGLYVTQMKYINFNRRFATIQRYLKDETSDRLCIFDYRISSCPDCYIIAVIMDIILLVNLSLDRYFSPKITYRSYSEILKLQSFATVMGIFLELEFA